MAGHDDRVPSPEAHAALEKMLTPKLADYGIKIERHKLGYMQLTSNRMLIEPVVVRRGTAGVCRRSSAGAVHLPGQYDRRRRQGDSLLDDHGDGLRRRAAAGAVHTPNGNAIEPLADDEIVLNTWAAEDLGVSRGTR